MPMSLEHYHSTNIIEWWELNINLWHLVITDKAQFIRYFDVREKLTGSIVQNWGKSVKWSLQACQSHTNSIKILSKIWDSGMDRVNAVRKDIDRESAYLSSYASEPLDADWQKIYKNMAEYIYYSLIQTKIISAVYAAWSNAWLDNLFNNWISDSMSKYSNAKDIGWVLAGMLKQLEIFFSNNPNNPDTKYLVSKWSQFYKILDGTSVDDNFTKSLWRILATKKPTDNKPQKPKDPNEDKPYGKIWWEWYVQNNYDFDQASKIEQDVSIAKDKEELKKLKKESQKRDNRKTDSSTNRSNRSQKPNLKPTPPRERLNDPRDNVDDSR